MSKKRKNQKSKNWAGDTIAILILAVTVIAEIIVVITQFSGPLPILNTEINFYAVFVRSAIEDQILEFFFIYIVPFLAILLLIILPRQKR